MLISQESTCSGDDKVEVGDDLMLVHSVGFDISE